MRSTIIGFIAGIALLQIQPRLPALAWLILLAAGALAVFGVVRWQRLYGGLACLLLATAGTILGFAWAAVLAQSYMAHELPAALEGEDLVVVGVVESLPYRFEQGVRFNFHIEEARHAGGSVALPPHVALGWYAGMHGEQVAVEAVQPGERWQLAVRLQRPHGSANPDGFDYEVWLLEQSLRATGQVRTDANSAELNRRRDLFVPGFGNLVERARGHLRDKILAALPGQPYAGVIVALVIGDQRAVAQSDWTIFNRTGIGHLVSISGLHITMIAGLFAGLIHFLWRRSFFTDWQLPLWLPAQKAAALAAAVTALLYVLLAGFGVPAQRTLYMLWVVAAALWFGRLGSVSHVLCLAALAVVVLDPWAVLWPGFWLSFGAVAVILFASTGRVVGNASTLTRAQRWAAQLREAAHGQYVVTVGLVPLTVLLFGQVSLVSPLANAIAIPLVSLVVTPMALAGSLLPAPVSAWVLAGAHALVAWLAVFLTWLSGLSWAVWSAPLPVAWMFVCALVGASWLLTPRGWPARWLGLIGWLPLLCNAPTHPLPGALTVTAFDVGQGMALLIETEHHRLLYDTGPAYSPESDGGNRVLVPYLKARGIERIDGIVITHNDNDHSGGALSVFRQIRTDWVLSSLAPDSPIVHAAPGHRRCEAGQRWAWDGVDFEMLHPGAASYDSKKWKPNARSCTLKITPRQGVSLPSVNRVSATSKEPAALPSVPSSILLAGDIEALQEDELVGSIPGKLAATVLLAPHHGSGTSSTLPFLMAVQPRVAIFQVGYRNRYHHPKPQVFERYRELGIQRLRNDDSGAITLQFGTSLSIRTYRSEHARYWYGH